MQQKISNRTNERINPNRYVGLDFICWDQVALLEPIYQENGKNGCRVHYQDGSYDDVANRCELVLSRYARYHHTTISFVRELSEQCPLYKRKRKYSMVFSKDSCVVPLKCREARKNESTLCYVVLQKLWHYTPLRNGNTLLLLHNEHKGVEVLQRIQTVETQFYNARQLMAYCEHHAEELEKLKHQKQGKFIGRYY